MEKKMSDETTEAELLNIAQYRARNSVIAFRHQDDPGIHEGRVRADKVWGQKRQELAAALPEGDETRELIEFLGHLDKVSPPPHLVSKVPQKPGVTLGDVWPDTEK